MVDLVKTNTMEAKYYQCDDELETLIRNQGWVETTDEIDKLKRKREFRQSPKARTFIRFDYINFVIFENNSGCSGIGGSRVYADDLRLLFWYLHSTTADKKMISDGHFDLGRARSAYKTMINLLGYAKESNCTTSESKKFERMLNNYSAVTLKSSAKTNQLINPRLVKCPSLDSKQFRTSTFKKNDNLV